MGWQSKPQERSLACNPKAIIHHRKRLEMTQADLAKRAGYTERLIVKAEAGNAISIKTIEDLAEALSDAQLTVAPEDLVARPIDMTKQLIFGSYIHRGDLFANIQHFLHPDIELFFDGDPAMIPFAGHHHGLPAVQRALAMFFTVLEAPEECDYESTHQFVVNDQNPNEVIVWGKSFFHPVGQPDIEMNLQIKCTFEGGKLKTIDDRYDTLLASRVFAKPDLDS